MSAMTDNLSNQVLRHEVKLEHLESLLITHAEDNRLQLTQRIEGDRVRLIEDTKTRESINELVTMVEVLVATKERDYEAFLEVRTTISAMQKTQIVHGEALARHDGPIKRIATIERKTFSALLATVVLLFGSIGSGISMFGDQILTQYAKEAVLAPALKQEAKEAINPAPALKHDGEEVTHVR